MAGLPGLAAVAPARAQQQQQPFRIGVVEAMAAGAWPLLPRRLSYPELLEPLGPAGTRFLYDGNPEQLADRLSDLAGVLAKTAPSCGPGSQARRFAIPTGND